MDKIIEFILYPDVLGLDITGPLEVFNTASGLSEKFDYKPVFTSVKKGPIKLSSGLKVIAEKSFDDNFDSDILIIPGGSNTDIVTKDQRYLSYIKKKADKAKKIVSVCKGSFILAKAGILKGKNATTHWMSTETLQKDYLDIKVDSDSIFVKDGNIYTSAGVTAGIDLALSIVEEELGTETALEVAGILVVYFRRPGSQSQFSNPLKAQKAAGEKFLDLHNWLLENIKKDISIDDMADHVLMSSRNFFRKFKNETGLTPGKYLEILRLNKAREIIISGIDSIENIAQLTGFIREERLRRAFIRNYGVTPLEYKKHFKNKDSYENSAIKKCNHDN